LDAGKRVKGKKRPLLVDTWGLVRQARVPAAHLHDRAGGLVLLASLGERFPALAKLFADGAYHGPVCRRALATVLPRLTSEVITRSEQVRGFAVLPTRGIVARMIAWRNRDRRLANDFEARPRPALAFMPLASIRLMLRKLAHPS
jgi:transposase